MPSHRRQLLQSRRNRSMRQTGQVQPPSCNPQTRSRLYRRSHVLIHYLKVCASNFQTIPKQAPASVHICCNAIFTSGRTMCAPSTSKSSRSAMSVPDADDGVVSHAHRCLLWVRRTSSPCFSIGLARRLAPKPSHRKRATCTKVGCLQHT